MKHLAFAAALLLLGGCAATPSGTSTDASMGGALQRIGQFTVTDLQNANTEAIAANDLEAMACFPALIKFVQSFPATQGTQTISGAFSVYEAARIKRMTIQGAASAGIPMYLKLSCSALVLDEQTFVLRLAALAGIASVAAPALPIVGVGGL